MQINESFFRECLIKAHKYKCFYTNRDITIQNMDIDHIIPVSKGGLDVIENLVPCHYSINRKKSNKFNDSLHERMIFINKTCFVYKFNDLYDYKFIVNNKIIKFNKKCLSSEFLKDIENIKMKTKMIKRIIDGHTDRMNLKMSQKQWSVIKNISLSSLKRIELGQCYDLKLISKYINK